MSTLYDDLIGIISPKIVTIAKEVMKEHAIDRWYASGMPDVVVLAQSTEDVVAVMKYAHEHDVPVYTRGAGVGYVGGCVPVNGGIALSVAQMTDIVELNQCRLVLSARSSFFERMLYWRKYSNECWRSTLSQIRCNKTVCFGA